jgi:2-phospho-L-lactate guanylyltransferase
MLELGNSLKTLAVIPVKSLSTCKERLSSVLNVDERKEFVLSMLNDVLEAASSSMVNQTVIVGLDYLIQKIIESRAYFLLETKKGLNNALEYATNWCVERGAEAILILPADIPLITAADINRMIQMSSEVASIVISPSRDGGTNALMRKPPDVIKTHFGPGSFNRHVGEASKKGIQAKIYRSSRIYLDIDSIQDLRMFLKRGGGKISYEFLEQTMIEERLKGLK